MNFKYFSKNGELVPIENAVIPLSNIEYQYGFGVYETIRVVNGIPYFLKDHLERLGESARIIGLLHPFESSIYGTVQELIKETGAGTYNLKILLIGPSTSSLRAGGNDASLFVLPLNPLFPDKKLYKEGVALVTYEYERSFPHAKTLNMLQSYLAYKKAKEHGAYDALLINRSGCITEGTRTNFFCIKDKTLYSPPESEILLGVTRKVVLTAALRGGFSVEERNIGLYDLEDYEGAFITSTSSKILPARSIGEHVFAPIPEALKELMGMFDRLLDECRGTLS